MRNTKVHRLHLICNLFLQRNRRVAVGILTALMLINGLVSPAEASDKTTVALQCSTTNVVLTCSKFDGGGCIRSALTVDAGSGVHTVVPSEKIPQNFDVPTIADEVSCVEGGNKFALYVTYSACQYAGCMVVRAYDLNGKSILALENDRNFHGFFGKNVRDVQFLSSMSLRGNQ